MSQPLDIIIVERLGSLKILSIKDYKQEDLYKKCGFKKAEDFNRQTEWSVKISGTKYIVQLYAKMDGRANSENKYDFPPPVDTKLFYGSCALVGYIKHEDGRKVLTNLTLGIWNKIYEKLFGGFEDLVTTAKEDEEEEDELAKIPKEKKTKHGYLKDGFVVDSSGTDDEDSEPDSESDDIEDDEDEEEEDSEKVADEDDLELEDVGSELSEESYDYDDNNVGK
jgi:hypothetical protein